METTRSNKYAGNCVVCLRYIYAGKGIYDFHIYCGQECLKKHDEEIAEAQKAEIAQRRLFQLTLLEGKLDPANARDSKLISKATAGRVDNANSLQDASADDISAVLSAVNKRGKTQKAREKREEAIRTDTCTRCGGAGRADKWERTGSICYKCNGSGKHHQ